MKEPRFTIVSLVKKYVKTLDAIKIFSKQVICFASGCQIEEININNHTVIIRFQGKRVVIKATYEEAIGDPQIIQRLSSIQACVLGIYYGRSLCHQYKHHTAPSKCMEFLLKNAGGKYKITYQDLYTGNIRYINTKTNQFFFEHPITIAQDNNIITEFDSTQACYIGILAGISFEKIAKKDKQTGEYNLDNILRTYPQLRIIK